MVRLILLGVAAGGVFGFAGPATAEPRGASQARAGWEAIQAETAFGTPKNIFAPFQSEEPKVKVAAGRRPPPEPLVPKVEAPAVPPGPTAEELAAQAAEAELNQLFLKTSRMV